MKVKVFHIRLKSKFTQKDEKKLNNFLNNIDIDVIKVYSNLAQGVKPYFAYSVNYENHIQKLK